ncbi:MAG: TolC family protein [Acidobacteriaceae bacterium]|nr:TolC family protein [Acidobacteriaceae bacterium]
MNRISQSQHAAPGEGARAHHKPGLILIVFAVLLSLVPGSAQQPEDPALETPTINLHDALQRARKYGAQLQSADIAAQLLKEDLKQAKAARLPTANGLNQFIYTEGNGTPSGVFVANDGVHVYNEQLLGHEDLFALMRTGPIHLAEAAEAAARAKADVAARGLNATVIQDYYTIANTGRRVDNARESLKEAQQFLDITQKQEKGGEVAHADVIKAQIQVQQRDRDLSDAALAFKKAKIALAILIFPSLQINYDIVDDFSQIPVPPALPEAATQANTNNPDLLAAQANLTQARLGVSVARYAYLPTFALDVAYGIDANQFAAVSTTAQDTGRSTLPNYEVKNRQNLGYSAWATLNIPLWDWGTIRSKVRQAALKQRQAELDLGVTQRQLQGDLASAYEEAQTAFSQVSSLRDSSDLSAQSLRLTVLRYQAGEATALEVTDAQSTVALARNAYADGLLRYRVALANLQILTGTF